MEKDLDKAGKYIEKVFGGAPKKGIHYFVLAQQLVSAGKVYFVHNGDLISMNATDLYPPSLLLR